MRRFSSIALALTASVSLAACGYADSVFQSSPSPHAATAAPSPIALASATTAPAMTLDPTPPKAETRQPFVVIHFEGRDPDYASSLYEALTRALAKKPNVSFDLVAVTRDSDAAERNLSGVYRTITDMGMPASRLTLSAVAATDDATDEVWIYVR